MRRFHLWPLSAFVLSLSWGAAQAADSKIRVEFKCHFVLVDGTETVRYLTGNTDKVSKFKQSLGTTLYAKDGKTRQQVEKINECVKSSETFRSFTARQLDKKTLS